MLANSVWLCGGLCIALGVEVTTASSTSCGLQACLQVTDHLPMQLLAYDVMQLPLLQSCWQTVSLAADPSCILTAALVLKEKFPVNNLQRQANMTKRHCWSRTGVDS